jgi:hypothetical protein
VDRFCIWRRASLSRSAPKQLAVVLAPEAGSGASFLRGGEKLSVEMTSRHW